LNDGDDTTLDQVQRGYDALAAAETDLTRERSPWADSHFQRHYSWPATRPVLPDVGDERVLLAGCGRGDYVPWFREQGATVVGVDASETAIRRARRRFDERATFHHADLTTTLDFAASEAFDLVFSNLVLSHIEEWTPVFEEFRRVLRPGGIVVATTIHPQYLRSDADIEDYASVTKTMLDWPDVEIPAFYRPMSAAITPVIEAGFRLELIDEPKPSDGFEQHCPARYRDAMTRPELLVIRARADHG
jgi:SAM-dependent methyltransferase